MRIFHLWDLHLGVKQTKNRGIGQKILRFCEDQTLFGRGCLVKPYVKPRKMDVYPRHLCHSHHLIVNNWSMYMCICIHIYMFMYVYIYIIQLFIHIYIIYIYISLSVYIYIMSIYLWYPTWLLLHHPFYPLLWRENKQPSFLPSQELWSTWYWMSTNREPCTKCTDQIAKEQRPGPRCWWCFFSRCRWGWSYGGFRFVIGVPPNHHLF